MSAKSFDPRRILPLRIATNRHPTTDGRAWGDISYGSNCRLPVTWSAGEAAEKICYFVVRTVNAHDDLVAACEALIGIHDSICGCRETDRDNCAPLAAAKAAVAKAKKGGWT